MRHESDTEALGISPTTCKPVHLLSRHNPASNRVTITQVTVEPEDAQARHQRPSSGQIWIAEADTVGGGRVNRAVVVRASVTRD